MGKKELYLTVPSFFRCPISLDVMKSPVSLSTGVTYDRTSIQRWLDCGNNTCPATMQVLDTKDFVPNHTLHRLIQIWSNNHHSSTTKPNHQLFLSLSCAQVRDLINRVFSPGSVENRFDSFVKILGFASESSENRKSLASNEGLVTNLAEILASDGPDLNPNLLEAVLKLFEIVTSTVENKEKHNKVLLQNNPNLIPNLAKILRTARSESRLAVAKIVESTAADQESKKAVFDHREILPKLLDILNGGNAAEVEVVDAAEIQAVLSCLISLSSPRRNKLKLIEAGGVAVVTRIISKSDDGNNCAAVEMLLTLLEMLVGCAEGRAAITAEANCVPAIVHKLMKVSRAANEHAVAVLWSLCYLFRDQKAREAMTRRSNGGLTKILLLMQSDCSPAVKKMCCDLLRIFRVNSKSCLSSYDTKTTHIMPC